MIANEELKEFVKKTRLKQSSSHNSFQCAAWILHLDVQAPKSVYDGRQMISTVFFFIF